MLSRLEYKGQDLDHSLSHGSFGPEEHLPVLISVLISPRVMSVVRASSNMGPVLKLKHRNRAVCTTRAETLPNSALAWICLV